MFKAIKRSRPGLKTGLSGLDKLMSIGSGIVTLRSPHMGLLSFLSSNLVVRNHKQDKKALYLHWVDYHKRYWTLDFDKIARLANRTGKNLNSVSESTYFIRAFSRDNAENEENWRRIFDFSQDLNFAILDSVSELYEEDSTSSRKKDRYVNPRKQSERTLNLKNRVYAIGMFSRLCLLNNCPGIVLDHSSRAVHPFLGEVSSVVVELSLNDQIQLNLVKHPYMGSLRMGISYPRQNTLRSWLA